MTRGLLTTETITAWTGATQAGQSVARPSAARQRRAQPDGGGHDGDGAQEIIWGSSTIASDGTKKCSTGLGLATRST